MSAFFEITLVPPVGAVIGETAIGEFFYAETSTPVPIYSDEACTQLIDQPVSIASGNVQCYFVDGVIEYDFRIAGGNLARASTIQNIWSLPGTIWDLASSLWENNENYWNSISPVPISTKTAQNVGQMYTANDIIRSAMRLIQVSAVDTDLTASELQDGLESLNRMLDSWSADELTLYQVIREQFPLVSGQNPYTMGYGGNFNTSRPMKIVDEIGRAHV